MLVGPRHEPIPSAMICLSVCVCFYRFGSRQIGLCYNGQYSPSARYCTPKWFPGYSKWQPQLSSGDAQVRRQEYHAVRDECHHGVVGGADETVPELPHYWHYISALSMKSLVLGKPWLVAQPCLWRFIRDGWGQVWLWHFLLVGVGQFFCSLLVRASMWIDACTYLPC